MELFEVSTLGERSAVAADELAKWFAAGAGAALPAVQQALDAARARTDYAAFLEALLQQGDALLQRAAPGAAAAAAAPTAAAAAAAGTPAGAPTPAHAPAHAPGSAAAIAAAEEDVVSAFSLMLVLLSAVPAGPARAALVQRLADVATGSAPPPDARAAQARLRVLANLFNSLRGAPASSQAPAASASASPAADAGSDKEREQKLLVLRRLVGFAADTRQLEGAVTSYLQSAASWGLAPEQAASFYQYVSNCYGRVGAADEEQQWLVKYLATFEQPGGASERQLELALPAARAAAINYIKAPAGSQKYEVPQLRAVKALAAHQQHARLHALVEVFAQGSMQQFKEWTAGCEGGEAGAAAALASLGGLQLPRCLETMRLLSLCTLASSSKVLSYEAIGAALLIAPSEAESWVVRAISSGLIVCKMDQEHELVVVMRCTERVFDARAWKALQATLHAWRTTVAGLLRGAEDALLPR